MKKFFTLSLSDAVFIMLINVKMPTIVGIFTFMSRINFVFSWVEHGNFLITLGPDGFFCIHACTHSDPHMIQYILHYCWFESSMHAYVILLCVFFKYSSTGWHGFSALSFFNMWFLISGNWEWRWWLQPSNRSFQSSCGRNISVFCLHIVTAER